MSLQQVIGQLRSSDPQQRKEAVVRLARTRNLEALPLLRKVADTDPVADLRYVARKGIQFVEEAQGKVAAPGPRPRPQVPERLQNPRLLMAWIRDPDDRKRLQAAKVIATEAPMLLQPFVREQLAVERVPAVAATMLDALGRIGDESCLEVMVPWLRHPEPRVRANAIEAIGCLESERGFHYLVPYLRDPDNRCRANAVLVLRRHGRVNVFRTLETMLRSGSASMQDSATFCLGRMGLGSEVFRLLSLAMESSYKVTRNQARAVLRGLRGRGSDRAAELLRRFGEENEGAAVEDLLVRAEVADQGDEEERWESPEEQAERARAGLEGLRGAGGGAWEDRRERRAERVREELAAVAAGGGAGGISEPEARALRLREELSSLATEASSGDAPAPGDPADDVAARLAALGRQSVEAPAVEASREERLLAALRAL